jgi:murein DD-endopeptidase MepM/ murein hydrolase activator NlpD
LQRREGIKRYLLGMGGRSQGEFAGGAETAMNYDTAQKQQQRARFNEMQKSREGLIGLDRAAVTGGIEGGFKTAEQAGNTQRTALTAGANVFGTETQSKDNAARIEAQTKDNAAQREIEKLRIASSNAANAAQQESTNLYRMQQESTKILRYRADAMDKATKPFARQLDMINMALSSNPKDANALKERQAIELRMDIARDAASKPFDLDLARVESYMYGKKGPIAGAKVEKLSK